MLYELTEQFGGTLPAPLRERFGSADGPALKVALYLLCEQRAVDQAEISAALSLPAETVSRAVAFWEKSGLIRVSNDDAAKPAAKKASAPPLINKRPPLSSDDISQMYLRDSSLSVLVQETQYFIGRTLDSNESRLLIEIYEYDKLPVDSILALVSFCAPRAKSARRIIHDVSYMATELCELGIDSPSAVSDYMKLLELREKREREVADALGLEDKSFSRSAKAHIARWYEEYGYNADFVKEAYLRGGKNSIPYINGTLKSWFNNGYTTIKETQFEVSNADAPVSKTRERGENSLIKRAVNSRGGKA